MPRTTRKYFNCLCEMMVWQERATDTENIGELSMFRSRVSNMSWWLRGRKSVKERKIKNDMDLLNGIVWLAKLYFYTEETGEEYIVPTDY